MKQPHRRTSRATLLCLVTVLLERTYGFSFNVVHTEAPQRTKLALYPLRSMLENTESSEQQNREDSITSGSEDEEAKDTENTYHALTPLPICNIQVIGVGGGGGNAVNHMIQSEVQGVGFWSINTDAQALANSLSSNSLNIGRRSTRGLGAGGDPSTGKTAAQESMRDLKNMCEGSDMVFITAGMGGGTGSGAAPVLANIAKRDCGCLTVAVVTTPFGFEGRRRMRQAEEAIDALRKNVDTLIVVSNDKLLEMVPDDTPLTDAFLAADDVLRQGVIGISEIILRAGLVNLDFADLKAVMKDAGSALMGIGNGTGRNRATDAARAALKSKLLESPIQNAQRVVFNIVGGSDLRLNEINDASEIIYENCSDDANIIFGALVDPAMDDEVRVTLIACDFDGEKDEPRRKDSVEQRIPPTGPSSTEEEPVPPYSRPVPEVPRGSSVLSVPPRRTVTRGFTGPTRPAPTAEPKVDHIVPTIPETKPRKTRTGGLFRRIIKGD